MTLEVFKKVADVADEEEVEAPVFVDNHFHHGCDIEYPHLDSSDEDEPPAIANTNHGSVNVNIMCSH